MIRLCTEKDFHAVYEIINDAAQAYKAIIPEDRWKEPYMPRDELQQEIDSGVVFWGYEEDGELAGVMGLQDVQDVTLIRHAYVRTQKQNRGVGSQLLRRLMEEASRPLLVGTWAQVSWAIGFYQQHGFQLVSNKEKDSLLRRYWTVPQRQIEESVVLVDARWVRDREREPRPCHSETQ